MESFIQRMGAPTTKLRFFFARFSKFTKHAPFTVPPPPSKQSINNFVYPTMNCRLLFYSLPMYSESGNSSSVTVKLYCTISEVQAFLSDVWKKMRVHMTTFVSLIREYHTMENIVHWHNASKWALGGDGNILMDYCITGNYRGRKLLQTSKFESHP